MPRTAFEQGLALAGGCGGGAQIPGPEPRSGPLSRKNAIVGPAPQVRVAARKVLNLPVQGRFLPLMRRVSEWQGFPSARVIFLVALHKFATRISMLMSVNGLDEVLVLYFLGLRKCCSS